MLSSYVLLVILIVLVVVAVLAIDFSGSTSGTYGRGGFFAFVLVALGMLVGFYAAHIPAYQGTSMHVWGVSSFGGSTSVVATAAAAEAGIVGTASVDPPAGFIFDPATGSLKAPAPLPPGYVLVLRYESTDQPLKGDQELKGRNMGPGQTWKLPKDATEIEALYWDKAANEVTGFVVPF